LFAGTCFLFESGQTDKLSVCYLNKHFGFVWDVSKVSVLSRPNKNKVFVLAEKLHIYLYKF